MPDPNNIIEQYYAKVPKQFRALIESKDFEEDLLKIGRAHNLHIDELEILMLEVKFFILGISSPDTLKENLKSDLSLSPENVDVLINELNATLFVPLRELLKGMTEHEKEQKQAVEDIPLPEKKSVPIQPQQAYKQVLTSKKLNEVVRVPHQVTDYSVGRTTESSVKEESGKTSSKYDMDPYHEIIE